MANSRVTHEYLMKLRDLLKSLASATDVGAREPLLGIDCTRLVSIIDELAERREQATTVGTPHTQVVEALKELRKLYAERWVDADLIYNVANELGELRSRKLSAVSDDERGMLLANTAALNDRIAELEADNQRLQEEVAKLTEVRAFSLAFRQAMKLKLCVAPDCSAMVPYENEGPAYCDAHGQRRTNPWAKP